MLQLINKFKYVKLLGKIIIKLFGSSNTSILKLKPKFNEKITKLI